MAKNDAQWAASCRGTLTLCTPVPELCAPAYAVTAIATGPRALQESARDQRGLSFARQTKRSLCSCLL